MNTLLLFLCYISHQSLTASAEGPVYINPDSAAALHLEEKQNEAVELVTQTVYGFLDFTTTIGNTVMVFSPQTQGVESEKKPEGVALSSVIETRPTAAASTITDIKPSKTVEKTTKNNPPSTNSEQKLKKLTSSIEVKVGPPATIFSSVVEVHEGSSSVVNIQESPRVSSKVEVRESPQSSVSKPSPSFKVDVVSSVVEVKVQPTILSSQVNVVEETAAPAIFSSVVEIRASNDDHPISGNNILEPEYDFLSRQPSEVVDETYRVFNLKPSSKFHLKPRHSTDIRSKIDVVTSQRDGFKTKGGDHHRPTGIVTTLGGTIIKDGATTVHETKVVGTYISGKYAQVLQSSSHVVQANNKPKPTPSSSARILKTLSPSLSKHRTPYLDPTPAGSLQEETIALPLEALFSSVSGPNLIRSSRRPASGPPRGNSISRFRPRGRENADSKEQELVYSSEEEDIEYTPVPKRSSSAKLGVKATPSSRFRSAGPTAKPSNRFNAKSAQTPELPTVSVFSASPSSSRRFQGSGPTQRRGGFRPSNTGSGFPPSSAESSSPSRRGYKPKVQSSSVESVTTTTSLYKFKLNRPGGRWQYKTTPKPRVNIRKQEDDGFDNSTISGNPQLQPTILEARSRSDDPELDINVADGELASINGEPKEDADSQIIAAETVKVEISTPADFKDIYYEIATIRSPYTFHVGTVKNTRFITVTSTIEKTFEPDPTTTVGISATEPLTENILASTAAPVYGKDTNLPLDSSIATLPPIALAGDGATPPLETFTETFSTTQLLLKTHILPVIHGGNNTSSYTLVQSYHVTRLVTATKTLPPMEVYHFVPSKTLNEFNTRLEEAGSELHLELEFGDNNDQDDDDKPAALRALLPELDLANIGSDFDLSEVDKSRLIEEHIRLKKAQNTSPKSISLPETTTTPPLSPDQLQQLALLRLLNPGAASIPQVITTSRPVLKIETVYESHVLPVINGATTVYSTISRPVGTISKTEYEYGTSTLPALPVPPVNPLNPLFPQQQQFALTSTPVVTQTVVTETASKILKLTFGAKTAFTTLFSTKVVPTLLTTYLTTSVPVQPTAPAFPGYFPAAYPQFPFVG